jgi:hypothetical protein
MHGARLGLLDEHRVVVDPILPDHQPTLYQGLERSWSLELVATKHRCPA